MQLAHVTPGKGRSGFIRYEKTSSALIRVTSCALMISYSWLVVDQGPLLAGGRTSMA
jgi:hypothetical protein